MHFTLRIYINTKNYSFELIFLYMGGYSVKNKSKFFSELKIEYPQLTIQSNKEIVVEGCKGIIEYNKDSIKISVGKMQMLFCGDDLTLKSLNPDNIVLTGNFKTIEYIF